MRGQGRVFKRGGVCWIAYYQRGRELRESAKTGDERKAAALLKDRLGAIYAGTFLGPDQAKVTVGELVEALRAEMESRSLKGWYTLKGMFPRLTQALGHHRAVAVTAEQLRAYERDLAAAGKSQATRVHYLWLLAAAFKLGAKERRIALVPAFPRHGPLRNARRGFVEPADLGAVLAALPDEMTRDVARFAYASGWREAEILGLTWEVVDRRHQEVRLPDSKSDQPRTLPLVGELTAIIERRWAERVVDDRLIPLVFHHRHGRPLAPTTLRLRWRKAAKAAARVGLLFHDLRRSAVRNLVRAGVTETVAMSISGHRSASVFRRYNITTTDDQRRALAATQSYVAAQQKPSARRSRS